MTDLTPHSEPTTSTLEPMPEDWQRALAIVAHPDDLEYGVASAIACWTTAGKDVHYVLATRGEAGIDSVEPDRCAELREAEQRASADVVGVSSVEFLDYQDGVVENTLDLRRDLVAAMRRHRPELVLTLNHHDVWGFGPWNSPDHRAVGRAALDAAGAAGNRWIFPELADDGLQRWDGIRWVAVGISAYPTHAVDVTDGLEFGISSLIKHHTYVAELVDGPVEDWVRTFLTENAQQAGQAYGGRPAVTFELFPH